MKLKKHKYTEKEKLLEFDQWITPSLGDVRDSLAFKNILAGLEDGFNSLAEYTDSFSSTETCSSSHIVEGIVASISKTNDFQSHLANVFKAILLSTGKSDNNLKCQYPIVLNHLYNGEIPDIKKGKLILVKIPRDFSLEKVIKHFVSLSLRPDILAPLLKSYLDLLLSDDFYVSQLYSLGAS